MKEVNDTYGHTPEPSWRVPQAGELRTIASGSKATLLFSICWYLLPVYFGAGCTNFLGIGEAGTTYAAAPTTLVQAGTDDWAWWRGPMQNGVSACQEAPTVWSEVEHLRWSTALPGIGHSDPSVQGDRIFLTAADEEAQVQYILGYDFETGNELWRTVAHRGGFMKKHEKNSHATATVACDRKRIFAVFLNRGNVWVTATDRDGNILWQQSAGTFAPFWGYASSPALYGDLVIVAGDQSETGFLTALDRRTGKNVWRVSRPSFSDGSYSSPIVVRVAGRDLLLLAGMGRVTAYDPRTGEQVWWCAGAGQLMANTVTYGDGLVYASGGYPLQETLCINAGGNGDVTASHLVWHTNLGVAYCCSPLLTGERLYCVTGEGVVTCFNARNGQSIWRQRLDGDFSASPILAGGNIYLTNEAGTTYVFKDAAQFELVAKNSLPNIGFASPVVCRGRILLRGTKHLYCVDSEGGE